MIRCLFSSFLRCFSFRSSNIAFLCLLAVISELSIYLLNNTQIKKYVSAFNVFETFFYTFANFWDPLNRRS